MTEVAAPTATALPPSAPSTTFRNPADELAHSPAQGFEQASSPSPDRTSQHSPSPQNSRPNSSNIDYPAFTSSLTYALVRDFAYPDFHPLHYGASPEPSRASTPTSDWNPGRRQSAPTEQWHNNSSAHTGGWSAGPWGGDGGNYDDYEREMSLDALPSTSFAEQGLNASDFGEEELSFSQKGKHRKSKSYSSLSEFERGRRRESQRKSRAEGQDADVFQFQGQHPDARSSRGHLANQNGSRREARYSTTLNNRHYPGSASTTEELDSTDEPIPLDAEPHSTHSPQRDSMSPEDEELFAGPSLALYTFEPENSNELRLEEGQEIMVSYRHGQGWLVASDPETGEQGLVPEAYVRLISDMPNYDPETGQFVDVEEFEELQEDSRELTEEPAEISKGERDDSRGRRDDEIGDARGMMGKSAAIELTSEPETVESSMAHLGQEPRVEAVS